MEEYLDSEKDQLRHWDLDRPDSLAPLIARVNQIRHDHRALHSNANLVFHVMDDDFGLAYSKRSPDGDVILAVVSLDPVYPRRSPVHLSLGELGIDGDGPFEVEDLLDGTVETWQGSLAEVAIDPAVCPARIFHVRSPAGSEAQPGPVG
jgi:starch synthase (maltosyl-transferring)